MATNLVQSMPPFDPDTEIGALVAPKWKVWLEDFEMFLVAKWNYEFNAKMGITLVPSRSSRL